MRRSLHRSAQARGLLLSAALLLVLEGIGHVGYRLRHGWFLWNEPTTWQFSPYTLEEYPPMLPKQQAPYGLATDHDGFVHNGYVTPIAQASSKRLIFVLGGSTVEGLGVENEETVAAQLEGILDRRFPGRYRVVNAGYHGYFSFQEKGALEGRIMQRYRPAAVVALDGRNDALYLAVSREWKPHWQPSYELIGDGVNRSLRQFPWGGIGEWLLRRSSLFKAMAAARYRATHYSDIIPNRDEPASAAQIHDGVIAYFGTHAAARAMALESGFPYFVFLQPVLLPDFRGTLTARERSDSDVFLRTFKRPEIYTRTEEAFFREASRRGRDRSWFVDLSGLFKGLPSPVYVDSCHYNKEGNRLIAERMAAFLAERLPAFSD